MIGNKTNVDEKNNDIDLCVSDITGTQRSCDVNYKGSNTNSERADDINDDEYSDMSSVCDHKDKHNDRDEENDVMFIKKW